MSGAAVRDSVYQKAIRAAAGAFKDPLAPWLAFALLLRATGLFWGLPASDGWDDDGVAPRDFLVGLVETFTPGHHFIYPPLQLILLALASLPVWLTTLLAAPSFHPADVVRTFIGVAPMTALAVVARAITMAMSLGLLWNLGKIGEVLGGERAEAGKWVVATSMVNAVFTYYSQTTNLDLPYLFWAIASLRWLVAAIARGEPKHLRISLVMAALAVATKDQAYALFLLGFPAAILAWVAGVRGAKLRIEIAKNFAIGAGLALVLLLVLDGAVTNPVGFADRIGALLGSASQDHAYYPKTLGGRASAALDAVFAFDRYFPVVFAPLVVFGILVSLRRRSAVGRAAALAPLAFAISFTLAFNMAARRSEHRFVLPQSLVGGLYAGLALDWLYQSVRGRSRILFWGAVSPCFGLALFGAVAVDVAMLRDPRYDAEAWMSAHVRDGDRVEVYGNNVHLPRLPSNAILTRVDLTPTATRNPLPGVTEVEDRFGNVNARGPKFLVVSEFWTWKYLADAGDLTDAHRVPTPQQIGYARDTDSRDYFRALRDARSIYRWAHASVWDSTLWPRVDIHASLTREIWIFERSP